MERKKKQVSTSIVAGRTFGNVIDANIAEKLVKERLLKQNRLKQQTTPTKSTDSCSTSTDVDDCDKKTREDVQLDGQSGDKDRCAHMSRAPLPELSVHYRHRKHELMLSPATTSSSPTTEATQQLIGVGDDPSAVNMSVGVKETPKQARSNDPDPPSDEIKLKNTQFQASRSTTKRKRSHNEDDDNHEEQSKKRPKTTITDWFQPSSSTVKNQLSSESTKKPAPKSLKRLRSRPKNSPFIKVEAGPSTSHKRDEIATTSPSSSHSIEEESQATKSQNLLDVDPLTLYSPEEQLSWMTSESGSKSFGYLHLLCSQRLKAIQETIEENSRLRVEIDALKQENEAMKPLFDEIVSIKEMLFSGADDGES